MLASLQPRLQHNLYLGQDLNKCFGVTLSWNGVKFLYLKEREVKRKGWGHVKSSNI